MTAKDEVEIVKVSRGKDNSASGAVKKKKKGPVIVGRNHPLWRMRKREHISQVNRGLSKTGTKRIESGTFITLTPINTLEPSSELGVMAKADYIEEEEKFFQGEEFPMWDDPGHSKAQKGELFAFCHNQVALGKDFVEFFYVTGKKPSTQRPKNWIVPAHKNRDVVLLSRYVGYARLTDVMVAVGLRKCVDEGANCLRGTTRRKFKVDFEMNLE